jgi:hypothetical protein
MRSFQNLFSGGGERNLALARERREERGRVAVLASTLLIYPGLLPKPGLRNPKQFAMTIMTICPTRNCGNVR